MIKKFEYNPENKICKANFIFLTKRGPIIFGSVVAVSIIMSIIVSGFFLAFIFIGGIAATNLLVSKKNFPTSLVIDFDKEIVSLRTLGGSTYESPFNGVNFRYGTLYSGAYLRIRIGGKTFQYFELLEGHSELRDIFLKNFKQTGLYKIKLEDLK